MNCAINEQLMLVLKPFGISIQQFNVLRILRGQKGVAANLFTVQEKMVNKMSNTTRIIDKLIDKSFVERIICKENRRKIELFITEEGLNFLKKVDPIIDQTEEKMTNHLSEKEKQEMLILLNKLNLN
ncbi:MAG: MarR family winged helix-turn-helix transcriptional regulator [Flavobacteriaceae bacterium]